MFETFYDIATSGFMKAKVILWQKKKNTFVGSYVSNVCRKSWHFVVKPHKNMVGKGGSSTSTTSKSEHDINSEEESKGSSSKQDVIIVVTKLLVATTSKQTTTYTTNV